MNGRSCVAWWSCCRWLDAASKIAVLAAVIGLGMHCAYKPGEGQRNLVVLRWSDSVDRQREV